MTDAPQVGEASQPEWIAELGIGASVSAGELSALADDGVDEDDFVVL